MHEVYPDKREQPEHVPGFYREPTVGDGQISGTIKAMSPDDLEKHAERHRADARRETSLDMAIKAFGGNGVSDPDEIVKAAGIFDAFLAGLTGGEGGG